MKKSPIVFVHMGNPKYLKKVIKLSEKYNNQVYLIGDATNKKVCTNWVDVASLVINDFWVFEKNYIHMSTNRTEFELGCFKRYYLLYAFMKKRNIDSCFMLDSDVCVYKNLGEVNWEKYDVACGVVDNEPPNTWCASPHSSFWKRDILNNFLYFLNNSYEKRDFRLEQIWNYHKKNLINGGVSDMVLLRLWLNDAKPCWKNLAIVEDGEVYDDNVNCTCNYKDQNYQMRALLFNRKIKKILFRGKRAYFVNENNEKITVNVIHAQGEAKMYISCFAKFRNCIFSYYVVDLYHDSTVWIGKMFGGNKR